MEEEYGGYPIQSAVGDEDRYEKIKKYMNPITYWKNELERSKNVLN